MRIAVVTGGRMHQVTKKEESKFEHILHDFKIEMIFNGGGGAGARWARTWCENNGFPYATIPAPWHTHDKKAGPIRNGWMVRLAADAGARPDNEVGYDRTIQESICIAFPGDSGTEDCIRQAREAGLEVVEV